MSLIWNLEFGTNIGSITQNRLCGHRAILGVLEKRFGSVPIDIAHLLASIQDDEKLQAIIECTASCATLDEFREKLGTV